MMPTLPGSHRGCASAHRITQLPPHQNSMLASSRPRSLAPLRAVRAVLRRRIPWGGPPVSVAQAGDGALSDK
jgi:hypothetical protein